MRIASIDIGSNTILLLIADVSRNGILRPLHDEQSFARLGRDVFTSGSIDTDAFERARPILERYMTKSEEFGVDKIVATGTSPFREAANGEEIADRITAELGFRIDVLSGNDEAYLTYVGAISSLNADESDEEFCVIDIGGGSTEISVGNRKDLKTTLSLPVGAVQIMRKFLSDNTSGSSTDWNSAVQYIDSHFNGLSLSDGARRIGVAGTVTTLACLVRQLVRFDVEQVDGTVLERRTVEELLAQLARMSLEELRAIPCISRGREDIIVAGTLILSRFLERTKSEQILTSVRGLRYGTALRAAGAL